MHSREERRIASLEARVIRLEVIRQALLSGDTIKAITLYRRVYGGSLKEAEAALGLLPSFR
jgi:hypothetical protein